MNHIKKSICIGKGGNKEMTCTKTSKADWGSFCVRHSEEIEFRLAPAFGLEKMTILNRQAGGNHFFQYINLKTNMLYTLNLYLHSC